MSRFEVFPVEKIPGAWLVASKIHADDRGSFCELLRADVFPALGCPPFVQANLSTSRCDTVRGLHWHAHQWDLWHVIEGEALVRLVDLRRDECTTWADVMGPGDIRADCQITDMALLIPPGVAHGFAVLGDAPVRLLYHVTRYYDPTDEHTMAWDDPVVRHQKAALMDAGGTPRMSARDSAAPDYATARAAAREWWP